MPVVIRMPEVATGSGEAAIQVWLVELGAEVREGQAIVEIETEKAVVEYEAEHAGVLAGILLPAGEAASVGAPIAVLAAEGETAAEALDAVRAERGAAASTDPAGNPTSSTESAEPQVAAPSSNASASNASASNTLVPSSAASPEAASGRLFASPLVRKLAREQQIDLRGVQGSGPNGRIVKRDLSAVHPNPSPSPGEGSDVAPAADTTRPQETPVSSAGSEENAALPAAPSPRPAASESSRQVPHTGMRRAIARRLLESKTTVPHFYLSADCRVDELMALRAQINEGRDNKVSVNDLVVKAVAGAFEEVPDANAIWTSEATEYFTRADIAIAVAVPGGLLTPVVREVDRLSIGELSARIRDLAARARSGHLKQHELEGGSFSVSNLGMFGTASFSAIINPPHSGILAVGAASRRPVVDADGGLSVANVMTVTLSADHRVLDGALAAQWLAAFVTRIERPISIIS